MDAVAGLLDGPRARSAFLLRSTVDPPWAIRVEDEAPLTLVALVRGHAVVIPDIGDPVRLAPGDAAVVRGPHHYTVADEATTPPQIRVLPGQICRAADGAQMHGMSVMGVRSWGNSPTGATVMLTGTYQLHSDTSSRLLNALPPLLVVAGDSWDNPLIGYLAGEIGKDEPGQEAVLDRLLDLLLIAVLRTWFARPEAAAPGWYLAQSDPLVGPALRLLQNSPADPWTVASLAAEVGLSRAALARRFTDQVGEPPMTFLTHWRLALAGDLLREPGATLGSVAREVGYGSAFALSTAFKRVRGVSPRQHRAARRAAESLPELVSS